MTNSNAIAILKCLVAGKEPPAVQNPDALLFAALDHRMSGLLRSAIERGSIHFPTAQSHLLALEDLKVSNRSRMLADGIDVAVESLGAIGVVPGTFKGVTAEQRWYRRRGERPSLDVDLFLHPSDFKRLDEVVEILQPGSRYSGRAAVLASCGLQTFDLEIRPNLWIDLHLDVVKWEIPTRNPELLMAHTETYEYAEGKNVMVLDGTMSLLVSLINVNRDRFRTLLGLADVARILDQEDIDWDAFDQFARGEGWYVHLYKTLATIAQILEVEFGEVPTPRLSGWRPRAWDAVWSRDVILPGTLGGLSSHRRRYFWGPFLAEGRLMDATRWWWRRVVPPGPMVDFWFPDESGPRLVKLARGRLGARRSERKRQAELRARRESSKDTTVGGGPLAAPNS